MSDRAVLAIDIGGTKLASGVLRDSGELVGVQRAATPCPAEQGPAAAMGGLDASPNEAATPPGADAEVLLAAVVALADRSIEAWVAGGGDRGGLVAVGVGCGGPMRPGGTAVSPLNIPAWRDFPLRDRLAARFGLDCFVDNDAKAFARAEGWLGAARQERNYLAMVVSTGVGAGLVLDGRLLDGASGNAGHLGHVIVKPNGRRCPCGAQGCLEAEVSGTSIAAYTGAPAAQASLQVRVRCGVLVGRAVASAVNLLDLRVAVVGGSVALGFGEVFFRAANEELARRSRLSFTAGARIVPAGLGPFSPLIGAGAVAWHGLFGDRFTGG